MVETIEPQGPQIKEEAEKPAATTLEPTTSAATAPINTTMQEDANKIITEFFAENYSKIFHRQDTHGNTLTPTLSQDEATMLGSFVATATIITPTIHNSRYLEYGLADTISQLSMENFLVSSMGEYVRELDLFSDNDLMTNPAMIAQYLPEVETVLEIFKHQYGLVSVYSLALSMEPAIRPLAILAIGEQNYEHINSYNDNWISELTPDTKSLVTVMQQYKQKAIKPVLDEIKRVKQIYTETWK
jgi:hypothetical protein